MRQRKSASKGSGCGLVGRVVDSDTRRPRFEFSHWRNFINLFIKLIIKYLIRVGAYYTIHGGSRSIRLDELDHMPSCNAPKGGKCYIMYNISATVS